MWLPTVARISSFLVEQLLQTNNNSTAKRIKTILFTNTLFLFLSTNIKCIFFEPTIYQSLQLAELYYKRDWASEYNSTKVRLF
ncbi:hypothetical protein ASZ90_004645 [hydrocarbon metagenome]|uniref:Uncharacterized protein n=1 Tax=hydrocarbon metagenome TaxID=938273 RepID=A0A0W8FX98_9ZZZZ